MRYLSLILAPLLSACSFSFMQFDNNPIVQATYASDTTPEKIIAAGGNPDSEMHVAEINGKCMNYTLKQGDATTPFYVAFDGNGQRKHYGYITCQEAKARGIFKS
ncbi:hypothetical protein JAF85_001699 [Citrobacter werkmanii]|uniref:hypothetical protein n=1 Tax=Citrobacter TaxID=544 RepID=UPI000506661D|nr:MULTISPECIES: hypothetical protein [Citrobacter]EGT0637897.1 hypothetical protein [Citrobacter werkmanii]EGT0642188.1 hypothetical protein [Citrobacter werkmanii]EGT0670971.1 hypothetical protein [Citrobacter werkmanii]MCU6173247.1 hypothetical protein [Citrobacter cronae]TKU76031.1 hypothetical protein FDW92_09510 [Citrobacter sp. wls706]